MTGIGILDKILSALNLMAIFGAVGIFVYTEKIYQRKLPDNAEELNKYIAAQNEESTGKMFQIDKLTINLSSEVNRLRFLDLRIQILPFKEKYLATLEKEKALINNVIIEVTSEMRAEEVNTVSGKILFELRIKKHINDALKKPIIKSIYFTKFVVQ